MAENRVIRVFASSPSDVRPERLIAGRVVKRLGHEFACHFHSKGPDLGARTSSRHPPFPGSHPTATRHRYRSDRIVVATGRSAA
jgi:hypothetical protein